MTTTPSGYAGEAALGKALKDATGTDWILNVAHTLTDGSEPLAVLEPDAPVDESGDALPNYRANAPTMAEAMEAVFKIAEADARERGWLA